MLNWILVGRYSYTLHNTNIVAVLELFSNLSFREFEQQSIPLHIWHIIISRCMLFFLAVLRIDASDASVQSGPSVNMGLT